eukprot:gene26718-4287_t
MNIPPGTNGLEINCAEAQVNLKWWSKPGCKTTHIVWVQSHYLYYLMSVPYKGTVRHLNSKTFASDDGPVNYHSAIFLPGIAPEEAEEEEEAVDEEEEEDEEEVTVGLRRGSQSERE